MAAISGQYQATQPTYTDKDFVEVLPTDVNGNLMVNIAAGETITVGTLTLGTINMLRAGTISAGTIDKIGGGTIDMLKAGTISAGTIGTVTGVGVVSMLTAGTLSAGTINSATINAGTIGTVSNVGTIMTLQAGEDQINDVMKVEGQFSYYHHVGTAGSTSGTIKASAGLLHNISFNTHTAGGTYALYDSSGTSATVIGIVDSAGVPNCKIQNVKFTTALTVVSGSVCDLTFAFR